MTIDTRAGDEPEEADEQRASPAIRSIADSVRSMVVGRPGFVGGARRDVHVKHHGLLQATFTVNADLAANPATKDLAIGVFQPGKTYKAWIRFSNSNSFAQSDTAADGRGIAIKLVGVEGERCVPEWSQTGTQDFIFLNGPSFFAADADEMKLVATLQAADRFPSLLYLSWRPKRFRALLAMIAMLRNQADSPLGLTYFSQSPYRLGSRTVKYQLTPQKTPAPPSAPSKRAGVNYLFDALRAFAESPSGPDTFELDFKVQIPAKAYDVDDASRVWQGDFVSVAKISIEKQAFATVPRMALAEVFSFNPYNGLKVHEPLGSINEARRVAYRASAAARAQGNDSTSPAYTEDEWVAQGKSTGPAFAPPDYPNVGAVEQLVNLIAHTFPNPAAAFSTFMSSRWAYLLAPALLGALLLYGCGIPGGLARPFTIPLTWLLPSEDLVPPAIPTPGSKLSKMQMEFRYGAIGTEANGGIPYWAFRALPYICPDKFGDPSTRAPNKDFVPDYADFGFDTADDNDAFTSYHRLPRGFVLVKDTQYNVAGNTFAVGLNRVAFNCATCHRGEYLDKSGTPRFVDGMPSGRLDTGAYQQQVFACILSDGFAEKLVGGVNKALAAEYPADNSRPLPISAWTRWFTRFRVGTPPTLRWYEELVYQAIAAKMIATTQAEPLGWKAKRPADGPGRLDAFGALHYEFLKPDLDPAGQPEPDPGTAIATVDLPSIWHEGNDWRPWHHWDGNTADGVARSYAAVVGVGGTPQSIRRYAVKDLTSWIDHGLAPPQFPFLADIDRTKVARGEQVYNDKKCAVCHGNYDVSPNGTVLRPPLPPCMAGDVTDMAASQFYTDTSRALAADQSFTDKLNAFGADKGLWTLTAFRRTQVYQCPPLDGIWARAPYLHNGSVPTLRALLGSQAGRPPTFVRGSAQYIAADGGFEYLTPEHGGNAVSGPGMMRLFTFDTSKAGNGNRGHILSDEHALQPQEIDDLIAYLYTL